jgi:class 3 adenylate cyclase/tetratricopeptide (TPR) repeat protein
MTTCPSCGEENPEQAKFCLECGTSLLAPTRAEVEERKVVTAIFCDLVGFTSRSEQADPEDVRAAMREYYRVLREEIEHHGGTVEKFIGDAVMGVFGAPVAHEDDPERAVRAGLRLLEAIEGLNVDRPGLDLAVRVGINTGEAVVVLGARVVEGEGMVTGDVINTAARLQSAAPVGTVVVGEPTYAATKDVFDYQELEPVELKGKTEPVALWRATSARARFGTDLTRRHTVELVGREVERGILQGLFDRCERSGSPQLVTIVGEPGVGKSRLVHELERYIDEKTDLILWRQGRCLPYGDGITFWALGEIVKNEAGILETDAPEDTAAKLDRALHVPEDEREWFRARLGPLVGIDTGAAAERDEAFTAWRRFLESLVGDTPGVIVFEDLHWGDPVLLEFIQHVAEWADSSPMLLVCTARPELHEKHPGWAGGMRNATTISLDPLSDEETSRLVSALLEQTVLPAEVQATILERAGGNPLYAEEFVRMLQDRGQLVRSGRTWELKTDGELAAPEGVQSLIAARLDTLTPERKALLQDAAVMGKTFWAGAIAEMGGRDAGEIRDELHDLTRKELVRPLRESSMAGEAEYTFWHMLVRDVAYQQIPRAERVDKHRRAAEWIEGRAGDRVEDLAEVLAHHYLEAIAIGEAASVDLGDLPDRALRHVILSAERAGGLDVRRAGELWQRALELIPEAHPERSHVLERWGVIARQLDRVTDAVDSLQRAAALYEAAGDTKGRGRTLIQLSGALRVRSEGSWAEPLGEGIHLLESLGPSPELVDAYAQKASSEYSGGSDAEAIRWAQSSIDLARDAGLRESVLALGTLGGARSADGDPRGLDDMRRAIDLGLASGEVRHTAMLYNNLGVELLLEVGPAEAIPTINSGIAYADQCGIGEMQAYCRGTRVGMFFESGAWGDAERDCLLLRGRPEWGEDPFVRMLGLATELRVAAARGTERAALSVAVEAETTVRAHGEPQEFIETCAAIAEVWVQAGMNDRALALLREIARPAYRDVWNFPLFLPTLVRSAIGLDLGLALSLVASVDPSTPRRARSSASAQAAISEAEGRLEEAAGLYGQAAERFAPGGWAHEEALAHLGRGRCLMAIGSAEARDPLVRSRTFFERVGAAPRMSEADSLLDGGVALSS